MSELARRVLVAPIRFYQNHISLHRPPACRFVPTCSQYAITSIERHGVFKGSWLAIARVARCHPWHPGGYDPVP